MAAACDRCAKAIKRTDDIITCMGFCEHVVHLRCISMEKTVVKSVTDFPNWHWMCDECTKLMKIARFRNTVASVGQTRQQEAANVELKNELAKHSQQIAQLSDRINSTTPNVPASTIRRTTKRRRIDNVAQVTKPLLGGTKATVEANVVTVAPPVPLFWIYLSRLHPSVKPDVVEKLTRDGLHCETAKAIPLVKQGVDMNSLNFISYKVGVDRNYRAAALDPSS